VNISAAPWSASLLIPQADLYSYRLLLVGLISVWLTACSTLAPDFTPPPEGYRQAVANLENWSLRGRLNIRRGNDSDTVNLQWEQTGPAFDISLSGTLGLGAVHINGDDRSVMIEKAGEDPVVADSLEDFSSDYLGYTFPARELLYWVRGLAAPGDRTAGTLNSEGLTATLSQADSRGRRWELQYDRYRDIDGIILPGRISLEQSPYRLTFIISDWTVPESGQ